MVDNLKRYFYTRIPVGACSTGGKGIIDIPENDEECEWLAKQNFKNSVDDAYTGE